MSARVFVTIDGQRRQIGELDAFDFKVAENGVEGKVSVPERVFASAQHKALMHGTLVGTTSKEMFAAIDESFRESDAADAVMREAEAVIFAGEAGRWMAQGLVEEQWSVYALLKGERELHFVATRAVAIVIAHGLAKGTMTMEQARERSEYALRPSEEQNAHG